MLVSSFLSEPVVEIESKGGSEVRSVVGHWIFPWIKHLLYADCVPGHG